MRQRLGTTLCLAVLVAAHPASADDALAVQELVAKAQAGSAAAPTALAIRYRDGKGVGKDAIAAMQWAHRAADAGTADAMEFVGHAYLRGADVKRNPTVAFGYFKAAADRSAQAAFHLGQGYFDAQGTEQD